MFNIIVTEIKNSLKSKHFWFGVLEGYLPFLYCFLVVSLFDFVIGKYFKIDVSFKTFFFYFVYMFFLIQGQDWFRKKLSKFINDRITNSDKTP
jgi:hypothetical protein